MSTVAPAAATVALLGLTAVLVVAARCTRRTVRRAERIEALTRPALPAVDCAVLLGQLRDEPVAVPAPPAPLPTGALCIVCGDRFPFGQAHYCRQPARSAS